MPKPKVLCIPPASHTELMFKEGMFNRMQTLFKVKKVNKTGKNYTTERVAGEIAGYNGLVTGWGSPVLTAEVFERANRLKVIAHAAGSVKFMLSQEVVERFRLITMRS
ncbi:MAG: hypothetical protein HY709_12065 [Candidatus Latescibacteria bacterium]|nr:hypothetical protein [Candidatus Latescibacterota bacterium]